MEETILSLNRNRSHHGIARKTLERKDIPQSRDGPFLHKRIDLASLCDHNHEQPSNALLEPGAIAAFGAGFLFCRFRLRGSGAGYFVSSVAVTSVFALSKLNRSIQTLRSGLPFRVGGLNFQDSAALCASLAK